METRWITRRRDQTEQQVDLSIGGTGGEVSLARTYNSQLAATPTTPSAFGYGWTGTFDAHVTTDSANATATVQNANGSTTRFTINSDGSFSPGPGAHATLTSSSASGDYR